MRWMLSMSLTPKIGAGDTRSTAGRPRRVCCRSVSDSQSISADGRRAARSERQRQVRVSITTSGGVLGQV